MIHDTYMIQLCTSWRMPANSYLHIIHASAQCTNTNT